MKSGNLSFGLNNRSGTSKAGSGKKKKKSNVFDDDGSSSDDDKGKNGKDVTTKGGDYELEDEEDISNLSGREQVNRQIAAEQAALRKRAQAAAAAIQDPSVYDYDGAYDSFKQQEEDEKKKKSEQDDKKSRYIGDLLKAAKKRERERDAIYERKVAKAQAEEDAQEEYVGKEKFITKAYKRKLEERKQWEAEEEEKRLEEEKNDVTKQTGGVAFGNFYGNFNKNVSMGGSGGGGDDDKKKQSDETENTNKQPMDKEDVDEDELLRQEISGGGMGLGFMAGFERPAEDTHESNDRDNHGDNGNERGRSGHQSSSVMAGNKMDGDAAATTTTNTSMSIRERREKKVAEARIRYLERRRLASQ